MLSRGWRLARSMAGARAVHTSQASEMVVFGLGNPGESYVTTRHNIGRDFVSWVAGNRFPPVTPAHTPKTKRKKKKKSRGAALTDGKRYQVSYPVRWCSGDEEIWMTAARSLDYMNLNGFGVRECVLDRQVRKGSLYVVYDCVDLPLGEMRIFDANTTRGGARNNGFLHTREQIAGIGVTAEGRIAVRTPSDHSNTTEPEDYGVVKMRVGVGPAPAAGDLAEHVLSPFEPEEAERMPRLFHRMAACLMMAESRGVAAAQNAFHTPDSPDASLPDIDVQRSNQWTEITYGHVR